MRTLGVMIVLTLATGCNALYKPAGVDEMRRAGVPRRHICAPVMPAPFSKRLWEGVQIDPSYEVSLDFGGNMNLGNMDFGGSPEAALGAILIAPVVILGAMAVSASVQLLAQGVADVFGPPIAYTGYSAVMLPCMATSRTLRGLFRDTPGALRRSLRSKKQRYRDELRAMIRIWNGPPLRGNPVLAIRSSGEAILLHARRLESLTGRAYGARPRRWIRIWERTYGKWRWERPRLFR